jgi:hypothetical protein
VLPVGERPQWRAPVFALFGALLLAGALALGGGGALLMWALAGLARWPLRAAAVAALYLAPGLAVLRLLWPRERALHASARAALAVCLGAALPPLLLLLARIAGLPWGAAATWGYLLLSLLVWLRLEVGEWRLRRQLPIAGPQSRATFDAASLALLGITLAALLVRLYATRDLRVGLLGDSYHHTLMAQLLVDNRGLFQSWQPYAPLTTFTYHFGFHSNAAFVHYVTGLDMPRSVVWTGQILSALAAPAVFGLAVGLGGSRWAGAWAALIVGFVANLPAFYVNWGRYTQLTGQIVLVAAVVCWVNYADETRDQGPATKDQGPRTEDGVVRLWPWAAGPRRIISWRLLVLTALVTAAMILTHYLVTALAGLLIASYLVALVVARRSWRLAGVVAARAAAAGGLALLLAAPWLLNLLRGQLVRNANGLVSGGASQVVIAQLSTLEPVVPKYVGGYVLLGALAGLLVAGWRREWRLALPAAWCALLVLVVVPYVAGLPGAGVIDGLTGLGTLYIPTALLAGYGLAAAQEWLSRSSTSLPTAKTPRLSASMSFSWRSLRLGGIFSVALVLGVIASNTGWQARVVSRDTALVTEADLTAMEWIRANTPPRARFLINAFPAYGGTLAAGSDAGWWLPLLARRWASLPPLTYGSEQGEFADYQRGVNALVKKLRGRDLTDLAPLSVDLTRPVALKTLADNELDYIYSGAHPFPGPESADRFDTAKLRASPLFRLVYERDGVEIFQFIGRRQTADGGSQ